MNNTKKVRFAICRKKGLPRVGLKYVSGEFIVKFKPSVTEQTIASLNQFPGTELISLEPCSKEHDFGGVTSSSIGI